MSTSRKLWTAWSVVGAALIVFALLLHLQSWRFGYDFKVYQMPLLPLVSGLVGSGVSFLAVPYLIPASLRAGGIDRTKLLYFILATGLVMRLALMGSEPVLEDDYQRYLWDGGVTAAGLNPYRHAPEDARKRRGDASPLGQLAGKAGVTLDRVNHKDLRTVYPPVAEAAFALAHLISPFSLTAWRLLCLACELASITLIIKLLLVAGRSPLWSAIYWWNPVAVKELINSAHMEAMLLPLLLAGVYMALRHRLLLSSFFTMLAAGAKLWPALLLPLILSAMRKRPSQIALTLAMLAAMGALFAWPILVSGLDQSSGFVAYAQKWGTNSALTPLLENISAAIFSLFGQAGSSRLSDLAVRGFIGIVLAGLAFRMAATTVKNSSGLLHRFFVLATAMFLLSPAQFPWYYVWCLPFLAFYPYRGLLILTALLPAYYANFHLMVTNTVADYGTLLTAGIWILCWTILAVEVFVWGPIADPDEEGQMNSQGVAR